MDELENKSVTELKELKDKISCILDVKEDFLHQISDQLERLGNSVKDVLYQGTSQICIILRGIHEGDLTIFSSELLFPEGWCIKGVNYSEHDNVTHIWICVAPRRITNE